MPSTSHTALQGERVRYLSPSREDFPRGIDVVYSLEDYDENIEGFDNTIKQKGKRQLKGKKVRLSIWPLQYRHTARELRAIWKFFWHDCHKLAPYAFNPKRQPYGEFLWVTSGGPPPADVHTYVRAENVQRQARSGIRSFASIERDDGPAQPRLATSEVNDQVDMVTSHFEQSDDSVKEETPELQEINERQYLGGRTSENAEVRTEIKKLEAAFRRTTTRLQRDVMDAIKQINRGQAGDRADMAQSSAAESRALAIRTPTAGPASNQSPRLSLDSSDQRSARLLMPPPQAPRGPRNMQRHSYDQRNRPYGEADHRYRPDHSYSGPSRAGPSSHPGSNYDPAYRNRQGSPYEPKHIPPRLLDWYQPGRHHARNTPHPPDEDGSMHPSRAAFLQTNLLVDPNLRFTITPSVEPSFENCVDPNLHLTPTPSLSTGEPAFENHVDPNLRFSSSPPAPEAPSSSAHTAVPASNALHRTTSHRQVPEGDLHSDGKGSTLNSEEAALILTDSSNVQHLAEGAGAAFRTRTSGKFAVCKVCHKWHKGECKACDTCGKRHKGECQICKLCRKHHTGLCHNCPKCKTRHHGVCALLCSKCNRKHAGPCLLCNSCGQLHNGPCMLPLKDQPTQDYELALEEARRGKRVRDGSTTAEPDHKVKRPKTSSAAVRKDPHQHSKPPCPKCQEWHDPGLPSCKICKKCHHGSCYPKCEVCEGTHPGTCPAPVCETCGKRHSGIWDVDVCHSQETGTRKVSKEDKKPKKSSESIKEEPHEPETTGTKENRAPAKHSFHTDTGSSPVSKVVSGLASSADKTSKPKKHSKKSHKSLSQNVPESEPQVMPSGIASSNSPVRVNEPTHRPNDKKKRTSSAQKALRAESALSNSSDSDSTPSDSDSASSDSDSDGSDDLDNSDDSDNVSKATDQESNDKPSPSDVEGSPSSVGTSPLNQKGHQLQTAKITRRMKRGRCELCGRNKNHTGPCPPVCGICNNRHSKRIPHCDFCGRCHYPAVFCRPCGRCHGGVCTKGMSNEAAKVAIKKARKKKNRERRSAAEIQAAAKRKDSRAEEKKAKEEAEEEAKEARRLEALQQQAQSQNRLKRAAAQFELDRLSKKARQK